MLLSRRLSERSIHAFDLVGNGYTDAPTGLAYGIADYVHNVIEVNESR